MKIVLYGIFVLICLAIIGKYSWDYYVEINSPDHIPDDIFGDWNAFKFSFAFGVVPLLWIVLEVFQNISYFLLDRDKCTKQKNIFHLIFSGLVILIVIFGFLEYLFSFASVGNFRIRFDNLMTYAFLLFLILKLIYCGYLLRDIAERIKNK